MLGWEAHFHLDMCDVLETQVLCSANLAVDTNLDGLQITNEPIITFISLKEIIIPERFWVFKIYFYRENLFNFLFIPIPNNTN